MQSQGVLVKNVGGIIRCLGDAEPGRSPQDAVVGRRRLGPRLVVAVQMREFGPQNRRLQCVQPGIDPDFVVVVLDGLPVVGDLANPIGQFGVPGHQSPAVPVTTQVLGREKAGATDIPQSPRLDPPAIGIDIIRPNCLGRVLNHVEVMLLGQG